MSEITPGAPGAAPDPHAGHEKGLKAGAVGLLGSIGVGVASTAPAYSLACTLGFVVIAVGLQAPLIVILAFIPMFLVSWGLKEMNAVDPDCGTSFTWAWRALGPKTGWWAGGWGTVASDFLAMASQSQIAGQYFFLLIGAKAIGDNAASPWVLLVGLLWIVILTYVCYRGIEVSARLQISLVVVEVAMLLVLGIVALIKVLTGSAGTYHIDPSWNWLNPVHISSVSAFMQGILLMVFIYWGWDTTTSINEESEDPSRIPGLAGVISTFILLATYFLVTFGVQSFAGIGRHGIGLANQGNANDVLSVLGTHVFGTSPVGWILTKLLLVMILTSAAATTQTTILPNARTTLSMAFHKALPEQFGRIHPKYLSPTWSTVVFSVGSAIFYAATNFLSHGNVISDSVDACTFFVSIYLGISCVSCAWHFRDRAIGPLKEGLAKFWIPALGAFCMYGLLIYNIISAFKLNYSYTVVDLFGLKLGGTLFIGIITAMLGLAAMLVCRRTHPQFFIDKAMRYGPSLTDTGELVDPGLVEV